MCIKIDWPKAKSSAVRLFQCIALFVRSEGSKKASTVLMYKSLFVFLVLVIFSAITSLSTDKWILNEIDGMIKGRISLIWTIAFYGIFTLIAALIFHRIKYKKPKDFFLKMSDEYFSSVYQLSSLMFFYFFMDAIDNIYFRSSEYAAPIAFVLVSLLFMLIILIFHAQIIMKLSVSPVDLPPTMK
jgi:hypothetical protein